MKANEPALAVVILAAGQGKRMKSGLVKVLHELCGRPMLAYPIEIANNGKETVHLKTRYWHITDATGRVQEVRGAGVVGEE